MNRHIVIGYKKGQSYKRDLGDFAGVAENLRAAKKIAADATQGKSAKFVYCTIHNCKQPRSKVGVNSTKATVVTIADAKKAEAEKAKKAKKK